MDAEKILQFVLEMQTKHQVSAREHAKAIRQLDERLNRVSSLVEVNTDRIRQLVDVSVSLATNLEKSGEATDRLLRALIESHAHADRRLRAVINIAQGTERQLRELAIIVDKMAKRNGDRK